MEDDRNHRRFQAGRALNGQIDGARGFGFDPVAKPAQRPVCGNCNADAGAEGVEGSVSVGTLYYRLDFGAVLVVIGDRRQRDLGVSRFAIAQDQKAIWRHAFRQDVAA